MHELFKSYVENLHPQFEALVAMKPVTIAAFPKDAPSKAIYLFSEGENHLYVGRTRKLRQRMRSHSVHGAQHNQAVFAFKVARELTGNLVASYTKTGSRKALLDEPEFLAAFTESKSRIRSMDLRFVEEEDPLRQALLEIYVSIVLKTPYNDFDTH